LVSRRKRLELSPRGYGAPGCPDNKRIDQIDLAQRIKALLGEREVLLVVRVIEATCKDESVYRFKIDRAEDRIGSIVHRKLLGSKQWRAENGFLRQTKTGFDPVKDAWVTGNDICRVSASQYFEKVANLGTVFYLAGLRDAFVEIIAAEQEVERTVKVRRNAKFLGERLYLLVAGFIGNIQTAVIDVRDEQVLQLPVRRN